MSEELEQQNNDETFQPKKPEKKRTRTFRPYPSISFEDALELAGFIQEMSAGQRIRRISLLDEIGRSESSSTTSG